MKGAKCGGQLCFKKEKFKSIDDFVNKRGNLGTKMIEQGAQLYQRAKCHPWMK